MIDYKRVLLRVFLYSIVVQAVALDEGTSWLVAWSFFLLFVILELLWITIECQGRALEALAEEAKENHELLVMLLDQDRLNALRGILTAKTPRDFDKTIEQMARGEVDNE